MLPYGRCQRGSIRSVETVATARKPVHTKRHANQRTRAICKLVLFREQLNPINLVFGQQSLAKRPRLSPGNGLCQKQPKVTAASAFLQIDGHVLLGQFSGQVAQALPALCVISVQDACLGRAYYHSMVRLIDQQMGRILDCLEERGLAENTLVIFTTDHGELLGDHGLWMKGPFHYEELVRIPMLLCWPKGIPGGQRVRGLVSQVDLAPTILSAVGEEVPGEMDGVDALPLLRGEVEAVRDATIIECTDDPRGLRLKTVVTEDHKLTIYHGQDFGELCDLEADPGEVRNLWDAPSYAANRQLLIERILDHMEPLERRVPRISYA